MLSLLGPALSGVVALGKGWISRKKEATALKHDINMAVLQNKQRLALDTAQMNSDKEMETLRVAAPWVRWVIVGHVLALFDVGIFYPEKATQIYENLNNMPEWVVGLFITVFGFYFAAQAISNQGAALVSAWRKRK